MTDSNIYIEHNFVVFIFLVWEREVGKTAKETWVRNQIIVSRTRSIKVWARSVVVWKGTGAQSARLITGTVTEAGGRETKCYKTNQAGQL